VILGADWVVPVEGPPIRDGSVRIEDGLISEVSAGLDPDELGARQVAVGGEESRVTGLEDEQLLVV